MGLPQSPERRQCLGWLGCAVAGATLLPGCASLDAPAALALLASCSPRPEPARAALWRIDGPNGQHGWLFGTIHILAREADWRSATVSRALDQADVLVLEIAAIDNQAAMQEVFRAIGRLAQSSATVLITGESGTGKELVARALHDYGKRRGGQFVAINMAAIPRDLIESELFGHEKGAFTGANTRSSGRFEQAEGGTLFLDEIGDMPMEAQTRLLRVLSDGQFYRVGGHQPIKANVRVIAATHQDLEARVRQGLFREDLFFRLNVVTLKLPAVTRFVDGTAPTWAEAVPAATANRTAATKATAPAVSTAPTRMIWWLPNFWISRPVTKPGAYIDTECARITSAEAATPNPHSIISSGVDAISRFIVP